MIYKQHLALDGLAHMTIRTKLMPCNLEAEIHLEFAFNEEENTKNLDPPSYGSPRGTSEVPAPGGPASLWGTGSLNTSPGGWRCCMS